MKNSEGKRSPSRKPGNSASGRIKTYKPKKTDYKCNIGPGSRFVARLISMDEPPQAKVEGHPEYSSISRCLEKFVGEIASTYNTGVFLRSFTASYNDNFMTDVIKPALEKFGHEAKAEKTYEKTYYLDRDILDNIDGWDDVKSSIEAYNTLPTLLFTEMVSRYDVLVASLLSAYFDKVPEAVSSSERTFTYKELSQLGSVEEARRLLIDREIDNVMFGSQMNQVRWLEDRLKVEILRHIVDRDELVVLFATRNIIVHNSGVINKRYIDMCKKEKVASDLILAAGTYKDIRFSDLDKCSECLLELGIILAQTVWRNLYKKNAKAMDLADQALIRDANMLLDSRKADVASHILGLGHQVFVCHNEKNRRQMMLTHASSLGKIGKEEDAQKMLSAHDWSACEERMRLFASIFMKEDESKVLDFAEKCILGNVLDEQTIFYDFAFSSLRQNPRFQQIVEKKFNKPLPESISEENAPNPPPK